MPDPQMPGDWVFRGDAPQRDLLDAVAKAVSVPLGRPVHFDRRPFDRNVLVVRGSYRFGPLAGRPDDDTVDYVGAEVDDGDAPPRRQVVTVGDLIDHLSGTVVVGRQGVVDETDGATDRPIWVRYHNVRTGAADVSAVLANLSAQTGLTFTREGRPVKVWCFVGAAGQLVTKGAPVAAASHPATRPATPGRAGG